MCIAVNKKTGCIEKISPVFAIVLFSVFCIQTLKSQVFFNAAAAYSLRKVNPAYSGSAIQVRRTCDDAVKDIGFDACGNLDTNALKTFVVASNPLSSITSTAAAAFSVRRLNCIYAGQAMRVRRSCDDATRDIGFTSTGDLDTVTLKKFILSSNPLSSVTAPVAVAYSLRKLKCTFAGSAIQVRRSSDNTTLNIGFTSTGDLDTVALKTFVGVNSGFISIWYDQSGSARDLSQPTAANQPRIVNTGVVERQNGVPTIFYSGSSYLTMNVFPTTGFTGLTINLLAKWTTVGSSIANIQTLVDNNHFGSCGAAGQGFVMQDRPDLVNKPLTFSTVDNAAYCGTKDALTTGNGTYRILTGANNTTQDFFYRDGSLINSAAFGNAYNLTSRFVVGAWYNLGSISRFTTGYIPEVIVLSSLLSTTDKQFLEWNQSQYYSVSGPAFAGMPSGVQNVFVDTWYDQSGNARHATQSNLALQPRIVSAGIIERQGNQPAVKWLGPGYALSTPAFTGYSAACCFNGVARVATDISYNTIVTKCNANIPAPMDLYNGQIVIGNGGSYTFYGYGQTFNSAKPLSVWTYQGAASSTCEFYYNGTLSGSGTVGSYGDPGNPLVLGNRADNVTGLNGWISEVITFGTIPSAIDRQFVEWTQSQYFNISGVSLGTLPVGAQNGYVNTWYDQSGSGMHAVQATLANQPRIIISGVIQKNATRPAILFNGFPQNLEVSTPVSTYPVMVSCIANTSGASTNGAFVKLGGIISGSSGIGIGVGATGTNFDVAGTSAIGLKEWTVWCPTTPGTAYPATPFITSTTQEVAGAGSAMNIYLNGASNVLTAQNNITSGTTITGNLYIGGYSNGTVRYPVVKESEVVIFGTTTTTRRVLLESNQSAYNNIAISGGKYTPPTPTSYNLHVNGIGYVSSADSVWGTRNTVGMGFVGSSVSSYLKDNGDYITAGINCPIAGATSSLNLPSTVMQRWESDWYVNKTDVSSNNGNLSFYFDFSDYGTGILPGVAANYVLLYRTSPAANFTIVPGTTPSVAGDRVFFLVDASNITTNYYYTIGTKSISVSPLPIELLSFEATCQNNEVTINWTTASESNNAFFTLERSLDGINYQPITKITGAGNSTQKINYTYKDKTPLSDYSYYRLKQTDYSGVEKQFNAVSVNCDQNNQGILIYPNPSQDHFIIEGIKGNSTATIYNQLGEHILTQEITSEITDVDIRNLSNGIYFIKIEGENNSFTKKMVIQH